jgi:hypothetical protein
MKEDPTRDPASEARDDHASEPRVTPETDCAAWGETDVVEAAFARRLERQRDEAREHAANAEASLKMAINSANARQTETEHAMRQRDELLEALEACRYDSCELLGERNWWKDEHRCDYRKRYEETAANIVRADATIAAVKGGQP